MHLVVKGSRASRVGELRALAGVMTRFWLLVLPAVRAELRGWQDVAAAIPDPDLRAQALATLRSERLSAAGAALFATTASRHDTTLVRTLVAYQVICDFLDTLAEQRVPDAVANGTQLHRALADALEPDGVREDYYRLHAVREDGGYLAALVDACREGCRSLPAYERVHLAARREARRNEVQGINHGPAASREMALRAWAQAQDCAEVDVAWFELAAASSSSLAVLALLAAAAEPTTSRATVEATRASYFPWVSALSTLLDSLADRERDALSGEISFIGHYGSRSATIARLRELTERALAGARALPRGERHVVLVTGMIAMHLSEKRGSQAATLAVLRASRTAVAPVLLVILRIWRIMRVFSSE